MKKTKNKKLETGILGKKTSKGQAMMEYLLTYGLALFVIVIVLAILVTVVLPALKPPEVCQFQQPGFSCNQKQAALVSTGGKLSAIFQLDNQQGRDVTVDFVACLNDAVGNVNVAEVAAMANPGVSLNAGSSTTFNIKCNNPDKSQTPLNPNANFEGAIGINYHYNDEVAGAPERLAVATITGAAQAGAGPG